jgi:endonuclease G, mitochondrial
MSDDKSAKAKSFLEWIAPPDGLEALAAGPELLDGVAEAPWTNDEDLERARETVGRLERNEGLSPQDGDVLEAIVLPNERPIVDVIDGTYVAPAAPFQHLGESAARATIEATIPAIGRIELPDHPSLPYGGTGFVVGNGLLMTNRHVAELFAAGLGREELSFIAGQSAAIDFRRERDRAGSLQFEITRVGMVHPYWDMALLGVDGLEAVLPLRLSTAEHGDLREREVVVIGYPAADTRNDVDVQNRIFGGVFNVKRLQPGRLRELGNIQSFGHQVSAVTHDSSTLGGNSGSAVIDVQTGAVVGLHFAGRYLEANYAVPTRALALDRRVVEAEVNFDDEIARDGATPWDSFWIKADPEAPGATLATAAAAEQSISGTLPLEVTIQIRSLPPAQATDGSVPAIEKLVEPFHERDLSNRRGYDEQFLGVRVRLPEVRDEAVVSHLDDGSHVLPYEHFSVVVNKHRRLALFTASNVDADPLRKEPEPGRDYSRDGLGGLTEKDDEKWFTDPRIPALHQLPNRFFDRDRTSFDKGHIVRREDVAWGSTYDEVRRANGDTYHVTNCSPQVASFNRAARRGQWGLLENLVLRQARTEKYCLFAGPVFRPDDHLFLGVGDEGPVRIPIPRQFWKIVMAPKDGGLQTFAFILDQDLSGTDFESVDALEFAVDQTWRERMISLPDLEELVALLSFPAELVESDQIDAEPGEAVRAEGLMESYRG